MGMCWRKEEAGEGKKSPISPPGHVVMHAQGDS